MEKNEIGKLRKVAEWFVAEIETEKLSTQSYINKYGRDGVTKEELQEALEQKLQETKISHRFKPREHKDAEDLMSDLMYTPGSLGTMILRDSVAVPTANLSVELWNRLMEATDKTSGKIIDFVKDGYSFTPEAYDRVYQAFGVYQEAVHERQAAENAKDAHPRFYEDAVRRSNEALGEFKGEVMKFILDSVDEEKVDKALGNAMNQAEDKFNNLCQQLQENNISKPSEVDLVAAQIRGQTGESKQRTA